VARDRQRAKQRKQRRAQNPGPDPARPQRQDVPDELDHASGQVDEFEAAIVSGGEVAEPGEAFGEQAEDDAAERAFGRESEDVTVAPAERAAAPAPRSGNAVINFLRASWAELQRVQWPDRRQVGQATAVVLGFVVIAGAYLGLADSIAQKIVDFIL
jgi:preprotein translocase subunit SecE